MSQAEPDGRGGWNLEDRPLHDGDLVEIRNARVGKLELRDWHPAVVFRDGRALELEDASDAAPGTRSAQRASADIDDLVSSGAQIRRREPAQIARSSMDDPVRRPS